ncbi:MAG: hypothetical protein GW767_00370 [Rhodobacterales bacterium]|nr:hypothetical protein [Rhodobacterales bacterium]
MRQQGGRIGRARDLSIQMLENRREVIFSPTTGDTGGGLRGQHPLPRHWHGEGREQQIGG